MSQNAQFEEEFRDGPSPAPSYQAGYTTPQSQSYSINVPGQKLLIGTQVSSSNPNIGARLALAIISLIFVFGMFLVAAFVTAFTYMDGISMGIAVLMIFLALAFAVVALLINLIFNYKR